MAFWRHRSDAPRRPAKDIYRDLLRGANLGHELEDAPVGDYLAGVQRRFAGVEGVTESGLDWISNDETSSFMVSSSQWHVEANCYWLSNEQKNLLIDTGSSLHLALYDPQMDERFDLNGKLP